MESLNIKHLCFLIMLCSLQVCLAQRDKELHISIVPDSTSLPANISVIKLTDASPLAVDNSPDYAIDLSAVDTTYWNLDKLDSLIFKKGVLPRALIKSDYNFYNNYIDHLNSIRQHKVDVSINGEPLVKTSWKSLKLTTTGVFSTVSTTLSPQKRGFWFSPDIFNFNAYNSEKPKVFNAYKYSLDEKLIFYLPFKEDIANEVRQDQVATNRDIQFVKDDVKGQVAYFNGTTSYVDFRSDNEADLKEITVTAWINPSDVNNSHSIIGKGEVFSAKIYEGRLQFTTPGIKDHQTSKKLVEPDQWSHVAFVYVPNSKIYFYLNGELVYETNASTIEHSDHSILIGSNLWGQNFEGLMSEFSLWTRALSDDEINEVYTNGLVLKEDTAISSKLIWFLLIVVAVLTLIWFLRRRNPVVNDRIPAVIQAKVDRPGTTDVVYNIQLLGGFKIFNKEREDITHKFSPKRKELLLLLILFSLKEGGITSKKMGELLWPSFSPSSVKNNRSTQIKEIRKVLDEYAMDISIVYADKKWKIRLGEGIHMDVKSLNEYISFLFKTKKSELPLDRLVSVVNIVDSGPLLPNIEMEWIDDFKSRYDNSILEILTPYLDQYKSRIADELLFDLCNAVLVIDPLHESAVKTKIELLIKQGKHMSAKKVAENFMRLYLSFYKEEYTSNLI